MKTYFMEDTFYITGGETSCGNPEIIQLSYIKECVKSLKTLGFESILVRAKFQYFDDKTEDLLYKAYGNWDYRDKYLYLELGTHLVTHDYENKKVSFFANKDTSYEYNGIWKYSYLNRITDVKIQFSK